MNKLLFANDGLQPFKDNYLVFLKPSAFENKRILNNTMFKELIQTYDEDQNTWQVANIGFISMIEIIGNWSGVRKLLRSNKIVGISLREFKEKYGKETFKNRFGDLVDRDIMRTVSMKFDSIAESVSMFEKDGFKCFSSYKDIPLYKYAETLNPKSACTYNNINNAYRLNEIMKDESKIQSKALGREIKEFYKLRVNNSFTSMDIKEIRSYNYDKSLKLLVWDGRPLATYPAVNDLRHESIIQYFNYNKISGFNYKLINDEVKIENFDNNEVKNIWKSIRFDTSDLNKVDPIILGLKKKDFSISLSDNHVLLTYNSSIKRKTSEFSNKWTLSNGFNLKNISEWLRSLGLETNYAAGSASFYFTKGDKQLRISDHYKVKGKTVVFERNGDKLTTIYTLLQDEITSSGALISIIYNYFGLR